MDDVQDLYRVLLNMKPLTKFIVNELKMAQRESDMASDFAAFKEARGKITAYKKILGLKKKLQSKM